MHSSAAASSSNVGVEAIEQEHDMQERHVDEDMGRQVEEKSGPERKRSSTGVAEETEEDEQHQCARETSDEKTGEALKSASEGSCGSHTSTTLMHFLAQHVQVHVTT